jgi:UDP-N-acetylmuramoylalanine--D-glutamate ligase
MPGEFEGQRVTVMGLGRFGGGVGVTRFLCARGADVLVTDQSPADPLADSVAELQPLVDAGQVTLRLGGHNVSDFTTCEMVVVNPAVPPGNRFIRAAEAAGIPVTTEVRLLVERLPNRLRTIGVTGSAGKSTVTAMIGHVLGKVFSGAGSGVSGPDGTVSPTPTDQRDPGPRPGTRNPKAWVGGNIGGSLLEHLDAIGPDDWVVLELSSFMLERLRADEATGFPGWSPHIAVVTNISENHLDWHGSMDSYVAAKQVIAAYQEPTDFLVSGFGISDPAKNREGIRHYEISDDPAWLMFFRRIPLPGAHNRVNAKIACTCTSVVGLYHKQAFEDFGLYSSRGFCEVLSDFPGLPHRLQFVGEFDGVKYYNDSKCTTPAAARLAVEAFVGGGGGEGGHPGAGVHLILGGYDKGSDLAPLAGFARARCKAVYTIGATGDAVASAAEAAVGGAAVVRCGTLERAVEAVGEQVVAGDVVLLSPGCASWDQFENYERRGDRFIELVRGGR